MPTLRGHHEIKRQTAGYAAFAIASVEMEVAAGPADVRLLSADGFAGAEAWRSAVEFGLAYAMSRARDYRHFQVTITLKATVIDSTPAVVALAVARAVLAALEWKGEPLPALENGAVVFPLG